MTWTAETMITSSDVSIVSAKLTDKVTFQCSRQSEDTRTFLWKITLNTGTKSVETNKCDSRNTEPIDVRKRCIDTSYGFDLIITKVNADDEGTYQCDALPTEVQKIYDFRIQKEADIPESAYTRDVTVREGDTAKLWCNATGFPIPSVLWQVVDIDSNDKESIHDIGIRGQLLQIQNVSRHCSTSYRCVASNALNRKPAEKNLKIRVNFGAMADLDIYSEEHCGTTTDDLGEKILVNSSGDSYVEKREGFRVSLVCSGSGSPNATIEWLMYHAGNINKISTLELGDQIANTNQLGSFVTAICPSLFKDERRFRLTFQVFDDRFTKYICRASNEYGNDEIAITIKKPV